MSSAVSAGRLEGHDIEHYNEIASPWQVVLRQMSAGSFHAATDYLSVNGILLYREHFNSKTVVTGATPKGFFTLGGPLRSDSHIDWCGVNLSSEVLAFATPSAAVDFILPDESNHWAVLIPEKILLKRLDPVLRGRGRLRSLRHIRVGPELGRELPRLIHRLIDKHLTNSELLADEQECRIVTSQLLETFVKMVHGAQEDNECMDLHTRRTAFRRAINYTDSLIGPCTVPELATVTGVSQRVLELAFQETLGITPLTYLRRNHMNLAYRTLRAAEPGTLQVTQVAVKLGFNDLGRFAKGYQQLFGELPSKSLACNPRQKVKRLVDTFASVK